MEGIIKVLHPLVILLVLVSLKVSSLRLCLPQVLLGVKWRRDSSSSEVSSSRQRPSSLATAFFIFLGWHWLQLPPDDLELLHSGLQSLAHLLLVLGVFLPTRSSSARRAASTMAFLAFLLGVLGLVQHLLQVRAEVCISPSSFLLAAPVELFWALNQLQSRWPQQIRFSLATATV